MRTSPLAAIKDYLRQHQQRISMALLMWIAPKVFKVVVFGSQSEDEKSGRLDMMIAGASYDLLLRQFEDGSMKEVFEKLQAEQYKKMERTCIKLRNAGYRSGVMRCSACHHSVMAAVAPDATAGTMQCVSCHTGTMVFEEGEITV